MWMFLIGEVINPYRAVRTKINLHLSFWDRKSSVTDRNGSAQSLIPVLTSARKRNLSNRNAASFCHPSDNHKLSDQPEIKSLKDTKCSKQNNGETSRQTYYNVGLKPKKHAFNTQRKSMGAIKDTVGGALRSSKWVTPRNNSRLVNSINKKDHKLNSFYKRKISCTDSIQTESVSKVYTEKSKRLKAVKPNNKTKGKWKVKTRRINLTFNADELKEEKPYKSPSPERPPDHPLKTNFAVWDSKISSVIKNTKVLQSGGNNQNHFSLKDKYKVCKLTRYVKP